MSNVVVRNREGLIARGDISGWVETFRTRALETMDAICGFQSIEFLWAQRGDPARATLLFECGNMGAVKRVAGEEPTRAVVPGHMTPFFTADDERASFQDKVLREAKT